MPRIVDWILLVGRVGLIAIYAVSALGKFGALDQTADAIASRGMPFAASIALFAATAELAGAACIAAGLFTRAAAVGLILYTVIVTLTFHDFWALEGAARYGQQIHFLKNIGLAAGFVVIAGIGAGAFSIDALLNRRKRTAIA